MNVDDFVATRNGSPSKSLWKSRDLTETDTTCLVALGTVQRLLSNQTWEGKTYIARRVIDEVIAHIVQSLGAWDTVQLKFECSYISNSVRAMCYQSIWLRRSFDEVVDSKQY